MMRSVLRLMALVGLVCGASARAAIAQTATELLGQQVQSLQFEVEGRPDTTSGLLSLSDVKVGQPLRQEDLRATIGHLDSLARYDDIVPVASAVPGGVAVTFRLVPRHPITRLSIAGDAGPQGGALKTMLLQRYGGVPTGVRISAVEASARQFLEDEGYLRATVASRLDLLHDPHTATLVLDVQAGPQARIGRTDVRGTSPFTPAETMRRTLSSPGDLYQRRDIEAALTSLEDTLRGRGFYEAQASMAPVPTADGVDLTITVEAGPRVELRVVPEGALSGKIDDLIPIRRMGAADQDLLEDAKASIERTLRAEGYWKASASFSRETQENGQLLVITFTITHGARYFVERVNWQQLTLSDAALREQVGVRDGDVFDEARFVTGLARVIDEYRRNGYYKVQAQPAYEEVPGASSADRAMVTLHPNITEGPRGVVRAVTFSFSGAGHLTEAQLRQAMRLRPGGSYVEADAARDRIDLLTLYRNDGFRSAFVDLVPSFDATGRDVTLAVTVNEGPKVVIGQISIVGNQHIAERQILDEMRLEPGQPAGEAALREAQQRLIDLGVFRRVTLAAPDELIGGDEAHVIVTVVEAAKTTLGYGGGLEGGRQTRTAEDFSEEDYIFFAPRGFFEIGRRNVGGRNRSLNLFTRVSFNRENAPGDPTKDGRGFGFTEYRVSGTYRERHVWHTNADVVVGTTFEQGRRTNYNFLRREVTADVLKPLSPRVSVNGRYGLSLTELFDERITDPREQPLIDRLFPQVRLSLFSGGIAWDRRDTPLATTRGTYVTADAELAARAIGSEVGYAKALLQGSAFRALDARKKNVVAGRIQVGLAHGFPRTVEDVDIFGNPIVRTVQDLPASQRFYAGGSSTVRGFQQDRLGVPEILTPEGLSNGGNGVVVLNSELRRVVMQLLGRNLAAVAFIDVGNVFDDAANLDFKRLRTTTGFGVRYDSPVGPIRLDFGFKVHPQVIGGERERSWEYHLSIGEAF